MKIASIMRTVGYCKLNWNFKLTCTQTDSYVYCAPFIKIKINLIFPPRRRAFANLSRLHGHAVKRKILWLCWCFVMHISQGVDLRHEHYELLWRCSHPWPSQTTESNILYQSQMLGFQCNIPKDPRNSLQHRSCSRTLKKVITRRIFFS